MEPVTARIPEKNTGDFHFPISTLSYQNFEGRDMWSSVTSKLEVQIKNGGMNMEKITISGRKSHVTEIITELMDIL